MLYKFKVQTPLCRIAFVNDMLCLHANVGSGNIYSTVYVHIHMDIYNKNAYLLSILHQHAFLELFNVLNSFKRSYNIFICMPWFFRGLYPKHSILFDTCICKVAHADDATFFFFLFKISCLIAHSMLISYSVRLY